MFHPTSAGCLSLFCIASASAAWHCDAWGNLEKAPLGISAGSSGVLFVATEQGLFKCDEQGSCVATSIGACEDVAADAQGKVHLITRHAAEAGRAQSCDLDGNCAVIGLGNERWEYPVAVAATSDGTAVVADAYHGLKKCTSDGICTNLTLPGHGSEDLDVAFGDDDELYVTDRSGSKGVSSCSSSDVCKDLPNFDAFGYSAVKPCAVAASSAVLFVGGQDEAGAYSVWRCSLSGQCEVLASEVGEIHGLSMSTTGALYVSAGGSLRRCVAGSSAGSVMI